MQQHVQDEYGVVTTNKFHFLSDDEGADPFEILKKAAQIKKVKGTSTTKLPQSTAPVTTTLPKPERPQNENARSRVPHGGASKKESRGKENEPGRGAPKRESRGKENEPRSGGASKREGRDNRGTEQVELQGKTDAVGDAGGRGRSDRGGRGRGRGNFTGDRSNFNRGPSDREGTEQDQSLSVDRRPTRGGRGRGRGNFTGDRSDRSGVPRGGAPKKEGHGKGNWGTEQDELQGETEPVVVDGTTTDVEKQHPAAKEEDKNDSGVEVEKEEEKPVGLTLEEWKQKNKAVETESFNVRKPNDDKKLNLAPLKKTEDAEKDNEEFVVLRKEKTREKHVDISVNFATAERERGYGGNRDGFRGRGSDRGERGGRGNRGGDRPNRGGERRGGDRANTRGGNNQFNLSTDQFPALGGH